VGLLVLNLGREVVADVALREGVLDEEGDFVRHVELFVAKGVEGRLVENEGRREREGAYVDVLGQRRRLGKVREVLDREGEGDGLLR
jgi:hypothetical protein